MKIILASSSPRRKELLEGIGLIFDVCPALTEEIPPAGLSPADKVKHISMQKALSVFDKYPDALVIAADTLVFLDGETMGKPSDESDAARMLSLLSGREHSVYTGFAVLYGDKICSRAERTDVLFRSLRKEEIDWYISSGEPMDKAGAYGAQGKGAALIKRINGDFFNVMGLPLSALIEALYEIGVNPLCRE